jgi:phage terminase large subunit-like protein
MTHVAMPKIEMPVAGQLGPDWRTWPLEHQKRFLAALQFQSGQSGDLAITPADFRRRLIIDCNGIPTPLGSVMNSWQQEDFEALDAGWKWTACGGTRPEGERPITNAYLERPRGHSKSNDLAAMATWILLAAPRKLAGIAAADDRDQAKLIRNAMDTLVRLNPWLHSELEVLDKIVRNRHTGSEIEVLSGDVDSSYGLTPDFIICDELTHWKQHREGFWTSLYSASAKREPCMLLIIANAGMGLGQSWQWRVRETARESPNWYFHRLDGPQASWISREKLEQEQRKMLSVTQYKRLWLNVWSRGEGDAINFDDIAACVTQTGPLQGREWLTNKGLGEWQFIGGLDVGVKHDHAAFVVLGSQFGNERVRLASCQTWRPPRGGQIDIGHIEKAILDAHHKYHLHKLVFDPNQALYLAQRLTRRSIMCEEMAFVGKNLNIMASFLVETFRTRSIDLYPTPELVKDLERLTIVERDFGLKLESAATEDGHADAAIALAIALPAARALVHARSFQHQPPKALRITPDHFRHGVQFRRPVRR